MTGSHCYVVLVEEVQHVNSQASVVDASPTRRMLLCQ